jgi:ribonuclease G
MDLPMRIVRDVFNPSYKQILVDSRDKHNEIISYLSEVEPRLVKSVHLYRRKEPMFKRYKVYEQIRDALKPKIWLKSGGYIVIEETEALTSIDVNTGRYVGRTSLEKTILKTNLEAAYEIGRQIRLRDIGGLIVIDFINMEDPANREKILTEFSNVLQQDRAKTEVVEISRLGLIEMTRKSFSTGLLDTFAETCLQCEGKGFTVKKMPVES